MLSRLQIVKEGWLKFTKIERTSFSFLKFNDGIHIFVTFENQVILFVDYVRQEVIICDIWITLLDVFTMKMLMETTNIFKRRRFWIVHNFQINLKQISSKIQVVLFLRLTAISLLKVNFYLMSTTCWENEYKISVIWRMFWIPVIDPVQY